MNNLEQSSGVVRDCLIGVVTNDADLERFARDRIYRIPTRSLGRALGATALDETKYLALYQTSSIAEGLPGAIEMWGEVEKISRQLRRKILPHEPDHPSADELYHLIRLKSVARLERPILSRRPRRLTFIRTTMRHLLAASELNDLIVGTPSEEKLWSSLKERDVERRFLIDRGGLVMELDFAIFSGEESLGVICRDDAPRPSALAPLRNDGWSILRFSPAALEADFGTCLKRIMTTLGGGEG